LEKGKALTDAEAEATALADPDNLPSTKQQLAAGA